jgi:pimeloyl-ACP methyl ester carboxylesterase
VSVPVEAELSSPIVHALRTTPRRHIELLGFVDPARFEKSTGLVMMQPYQRGKIPVIFVHGLLSDPLTWKEMFNELGADPEIRSRYQFWAFFYPTGLPFIKSAAKLREDLAQVKNACDPEGADPALENMILVGHSMGGLIAKLQVTKGGDRYWNLIGTKPIDELRTSDANRELLRKIFYFEPQPCVRRVVTIGTPHRGSSYGKAFIGRLGSWLVRIPRMVMEVQQQLIRDNPDAFLPGFKGTFPTSVDLLAQDSPILKVMYDDQLASSVQFHNVFGIASVMKEGLGDGVVPASSARLPNVASELAVDALHANVHQHPRTILEIKRILRRHYQETQENGRLRPVIPASGTNAVPMTTPVVVPANG